MATPPSANTNAEQFRCLVREVVDRRSLCAESQVNEARTTARRWRQRDLRGCEPLPLETRCREARQLHCRRQSDSRRVRRRSAELGPEAVVLRACPAKSHLSSAPTDFAKESPSHKIPSPP